ncbi:MAG: hypothetical protein IPM74_17005 [Crocinitomicaceae bacterium]|nr:hypothetical protein [Crocinitomicaceae bacterium]
MSPFNLNKKFGDELDINSMSHSDLIASLTRIFVRDMVNFPCKEFNGRLMVYRRDPLDTERALDHLIKNKEEGKREFIDYKRASRLHWIKTFLEKGLTSKKYLVFSHQKPGETIRTYIYHRKMKHVVILEPNIEKNEYYLITSYRVYGDGITAMERQYQNRLPDLY